jgi:hypothetical protein
MMRILRTHQFVMGISYRYRPKTASADRINRAIRVCAMEELAHCHHRFTPIRPEFKALCGLKLCFLCLGSNCHAKLLKSSSYVRPKSLYGRDETGERLRGRATRRRSRIAWV